MRIQDLMLHFRGQVKDEAEPFLWTDDEVLRYLIDAQDTFVRLTGGIADQTVAAADAGAGTTARLTDLVLTEDDPWSAHSPYILRIRSGRLLTARIDVKFINEADLEVTPVSDYGWSRGMSLDDTDIGDVRFGCLGLRDNYVRWFRVPDGDDTCRLSVRRLPYPRLPAAFESISNGSATYGLEIGEQHHLSLVYWMKHLAYSKEDAETYDKGLADSNEAKFRSYCEQALREVERARFKPRAVQFSCPGY